MSHTPGPWGGRNYRDGLGIDVLSGSGICVATTPGDAAHDFANAHLIAAAPELLAALKAAVEIVAEELATIIDCHTLGGDRSTLEDGVREDVERFEDVVADSRAAIAKAAGGAA
jgi:hypothetical protein